MAPSPTIAGASIAKPVTDVAVRDPIAYTASLERFDTFLRTELGIIFKTPLVMLRALGT